MDSVISSGSLLSLLLLLPLKSQSSVLGKLAQAGTSLTCSTTARVNKNEALQEALSGITTFEGV